MKWIEEAGNVPDNIIDLLETVSNQISISSSVPELAVISLPIEHIDRYVHNEGKRLILGGEHSKILYDAVFEYGVNDFTVTACINHAIESIK